jgi:hypothetical protein
MACDFETTDRKFILKSNQYDSGYLRHPENALADLSEQLAGKDTAAANTVLFDSHLLPGLNIVAARDEAGIMRDTTGANVLLTEKELRQRAAEELKAITDGAKLATEAFDHLHSGFDGPLGLLFPAQMTKDDISSALKNKNLTPEEIVGLNIMQQEFGRLSLYDTSITREDISSYPQNETERMDRKLSNFIDNEDYHSEPLDDAGYSRSSYHWSSGESKEDRDANPRTFSVFDWNEPGACRPLRETELSPLKSNRPKL